MPIEGPDSNVGARPRSQSAIIRPTSVTPESKKLIEEKDRASLGHALQLKADDFYLSVVSDGNKRKVCGLSALYTGLRWIAALAGDKPSPGKLLAYAQADDPAGGVVSFAGAIFPA